MLCGTVDTTKHGTTATLVRTFIHTVMAPIKIKCCLARFDYRVSNQYSKHKM